MSTHAPLKSVAKNDARIVTLDVTGYRLADGELETIIMCDAERPADYAGAKQLGEAFLNELETLLDPGALESRETARTIDEARETVARVKVDLDTGSREVMLNPATLCENADRAGVSFPTKVGEER